MDETVSKTTDSLAFPGRKTDAVEWLERNIDTSERANFHVQ